MPVAVVPQAGHNEQGEVPVRRPSAWFRARVSAWGYVRESGAETLVVVL